MTTQPYVFYNSSESLKKLDQNTVACKESTQFPVNIYKKEPFNPSKCFPRRGIMCQNYPRNKNKDYFFGTERTTHPDHFSRFGYPWFENGYGVGNFPGRYNTPEVFRWQTGAMPVNTAPERFYKGTHIDPNYTSSEAYNAAFQARQNR